MYHRNLKPYPNLLVTSDESPFGENIYLVPTLLRCNTLKEEPYLTGLDRKINCFFARVLCKVCLGNLPIKVFCSGQQVTFRNLKVTTTSLQHQNTLFCINFELRQYAGENFGNFVILDSVHTNPICILSHSNQLKSGNLFFFFGCFT